MVAKMTWDHITASVFWGAAAVSVMAWFLARAVRRSAAKPPAGKDRRSFPRLPLGFRATLNLPVGDGTSAAVRVRGYDLTRFGARVVSKHPIPAGSVVVLDLASYHLVAVGHVRHCKPHRGRFAIGMAFPNPPMRSPEGNWTLSVISQS